MPSLKKLKWSIQALAASCETQLSLFPNFVEVADELASEWEESFSGNKEQLKSRFTQKQFTTLHELDLALDTISGKEEFWTEQALRELPEWARIRELAKLALEQCGWTNEVPPRERGSIYVGSGGKNSKCDWRQIFLVLGALIFLVPAAMAIAFVWSDDFLFIGESRPLSNLAGLFPAVLLFVSPVVAFLLTAGRKLKLRVLSTIFILLWSIASFWMSSEVPWRLDSYENRFSRVISYLDEIAKPLISDLIASRQNTGQFPEALSEIEPHPKQIPELNVGGISPRFSYRREGPEDFTLLVAFTEQNPSGPTEIRWQRSKQEKMTGFCCEGEICEKKFRCPYP